MRKAPPGAPADVRRARAGARIDASAHRCCCCCARIAIFDERLREAQSGAVGEIVISGPCLARGYPDDPKQAAEKCLAHPSRAGERAYRMGNLARRLPDGAIQFVGRLDGQVKIRGYLVEPGEVEIAIARQAGVRRRAVVATSPADGAPREFDAFVVPDDPAAPPARRPPARGRGRIAAAFHGARAFRDHRCAAAVRERQDRQGGARRDARAVHHSARAVNFIKPYAAMKRDNVDGLVNVIRFAAAARVKALSRLSTISVYSWGHRITGKTVMREDDDLDQNLDAVRADIGYVKSKWVMEKRADAARGLPLITFRVGYATYRAQTGAPTTNGGGGS
ncbi:SDR family oxidoreductase [Burkholderia pseudomallei]|uniref:SDR family oxidoreductase n=2 Tax=Burkholderia pseudomallei TaxID=28450 RepID=UPI001F338B57|nr:SDR family oxidoreductase [Burkholderia pseudomallei]